ncbi:MAG: glycosyltransferase, partial [archaeon]
MNIFYVYRADLPDNKPGINFVIYTMHAIAKISPKNDVYLILDNIKQDLSIKNILKNKFSLSTLPNFNIITLSDRKLAKMTTSFYFAAYKKINKLVSSKNQNIVISRTDGFLPFLIFLSRKANIKTFFEAHDFYLNKKRNKGLKKYLYHKKFIPALDGIIIHQNILKGLYKKYLPKQNILMARTGLNEIDNSINSWNNNDLIYIGSINSRKRIKDIIVALSRINNKELNLKIVGGKSEKDINRILSFANKLGVQDRIKVTGWISQNDIKPYLKQAKIGLIPLEDTYFNNYLTSPLKVFDYFSHVLPIISTDMPSTRDVITEDCGLFYNNIEELVDAINKLDSDYKLYQNISENIYHRATNLMW